MARVIISSGHTSTSPGTMVGDLREVDLARKIAKMVTPHLRKNGIITLSVPYDLSLPKRIDWINNTGYRSQLNDVMIEIHINEGGKSGVEAWYVKDDDGASKDLANSITESITDYMGLKTNGVNDEKTHAFGGIGMLQQVSPVPVLIECLYIDNKSDQEILKSDQKLDKLAKSIAIGIAQFIGVDISDDDTVDAAAKGAGDKASSKPSDNSKNKNTTNKDKEEGKSKKTESKNADGNKTDSGKPDEGDDQPALKPKSAAESSVKSELKPFSSGNVKDDRQDSKPARQIPPPPKPISPINQNPGFGPPASATQAPSSFGGGAGNKPTMTRDERKEMVQKHYQKAFGKEVAQGDLNYFLNIGITEEQFLKRILDSQDHLDQVGNANKYADLKQKFDDLEGKYQSLERTHADQRAILEKLNSLLLQKNQALSKLQKRSQYLINKLEDLQAGQGPPKAKIDYEESTLEKIFKYLSKRLS